MDKSDQLDVLKCMDEKVRDPEITGVYHEANLAKILLATQDAALGALKRGDHVSLVGFGRPLRPEPTDGGDD